MKHNSTNYQVRRVKDLGGIVTVKNTTITGRHPLIYMATASLKIDLDATVRLSLECQIAEAVREAMKDVFRNMRYFS